jgi:hypothetical protein
MIFYCVNFCLGVRKTLNSELWHACAGPLVSLHQVGGLVYYFPQGHNEQVNETNFQSVFFLCIPLLFLSFFYTFTLCMIVVSMHSFDVLILSYKHDSISYKCV